MDAKEKVTYRGETWYFNRQFMSGNGTKDIMMIEIHNEEETIVVPEWEIYNHSYKES